MATITASLERSLQNCSLNQTTTTTRGRRAGGGPRSSPSDTPNHNQSELYSNASSSDDNSAFVDLNSHVSLPYHWEQCLDLKTGEIYYINWSNGMKAKEDPRTLGGSGGSGSRSSYYSEVEEENESNGGCGYDSEGSSTESSSSSSSSLSSSTSTRESFRSIKKNKVAPPAISHELYGDDEDDQGGVHQEVSSGSDSILVVAGCKACLMYYMVPKHVQDCPKCCSHLLHFPPNHKPS